MYDIKYYQKNENQLIRNLNQTFSLLQVGRNAWRLKVPRKLTGLTSSLFQYFKMIIPVGSFASGVVRQLL